MTKRSTPFSPEVRKRAARMVFDHRGEHGSEYGGMRSIAAAIGWTGETLRNWVRQAERDITFVVDALEQALHERRPLRGSGLVQPR
jgi:transposase